METTDQPLWMIEKWQWNPDREEGYWHTSELQEWEFSGTEGTRVRPRHLSITFERAVNTFKSAQQRWGSLDKTLYRLRHVQTGDVVMGAIL